MVADIYARVGATIRRRRREVRLTQAMLASAAGLSRSSITNIENGGQAILLHQFLDIAKALNTDPSGILAIATETDQNRPQDLVGTSVPRATELLARLPAGRSRKR